MAGYREFVTGEVLTAANVDDFLAKQAVMKFADASARDTALGTAVGGGNALREGMVAYLDSTDEVIKYDGTDWSSVAPAIAGIGSNVVSVTTVSPFTTTSGSYVVPTGLEATITPTSSSSKILIIGTITMNAPDVGAGEVGARASMFRGTTNLSVPTSPGNRVPGMTVVSHGGLTRPDRVQPVQTMTFLDSPNTTSATTYSIRVALAGSGTLYVNREGADTDTSERTRTVSTITVIEVAA